MRGTRKRGKGGVGEQASLLQVEGEAAGLLPCQTVRRSHPSPPRFDALRVHLSLLLPLMRVTSRAIRTLLRQLHLGEGGMGVEALGWRMLGGSRFEATLLGRGTGESRVFRMLGFRVHL